MMDAGEQENVERQSSQRIYESQDSQDSQDESQDEDPAEACSMLQNSEDEEPVLKIPGTPLRRPIDRRLQPKKRWLREARLEQQLAKPLRWDSQVKDSFTYTIYDSSSVLNSDEIVIEAQSTGIISFFCV